MSQSSQPLWYHLQAGQPRGPLPLAELQALIADGVVKHADLVWHEGMPAWATVESVKSLLALPSTAAPPPLPPSIPVAQVAAPTKGGPMPPTPATATWETPAFNSLHWLFFLLPLCPIGCFLAWHNPRWTLLQKKCVIGISIGCFLAVLCAMLIAVADTTPGTVGIAVLVTLLACYTVLSLALHIINYERKGKWTPASYLGYFISSGLVEVPFGVVGGLATFFELGDSGGTVRPQPQTDLGGGADTSPRPQVSERKPPQQERTEPEPGPRRVTAVALQGAVIVSQDGAMLRYRKKCESCGHVEPGTTSMQIPGGIHGGSFSCSRCRNRQEVQIQGGR